MASNSAEGFSNRHNPFPATPNIIIHALLIFKNDRVSKAFLKSRKILKKWRLLFNLLVLKETELCQKLTEPLFPLEPILSGQNVLTKPQKVPQSSTRIFFETFFTDENGDISLQLPQSHL